MTKHTRISFMKSGIRILGFIALPHSLLQATILLIGAEIIGIIEETVI